MHEKGRPCGRPFSIQRSAPGLRSELADERRPVGEGTPRARPVIRSAACAEEVVATSTGKERAAPLRVVARVADVLARDPDGIPVDCGGTVVAPTRANGVREPLLPVTGEAVIGSRTFAARDGVPVADAGARVDRGI